MVQSEVMGANLPLPEQAWKVTPGLLGHRANLIAFVLLQKICNKNGAFNSNLMEHNFVATGREVRAAVLDLLWGSTILLSSCLRLREALLGAALDCA